MGNRGTQRVVEEMATGRSAATAPPGTTGPAAVPAEGATAPVLDPVLAASDVVAGPAGRQGATPSSGAGAEGGPGAAVRTGAVEGAPEGEAPTGAEEHVEGEEVAPAGEAPEAAEDEEAAAAEAPSVAEAVAPTVAAVAARARAQRAHRPPEAAAANASAAAVDPRVEQERAAATSTVAVLDADTEEVKRNEFRTALREAIRKATPEPKTEEAAERVMEEGAREANEAMRGQLAVQREAAAGPMRSAAATEVDPSSQPAPDAVDLDVEPQGPPPPPVPADPVVPAPLPPERVDYSDHRSETEEAMAGAGITTEQLARGNEPAFAPALEARSEAEEHEAAAPVAYREAEAQTRADARTGAAERLAGGLRSMFGRRGERLAEVGALQESSRAKQAEERRQVAERIDQIKGDARTAVGTILDEMDTEAERLFAEGLEAAEEAYDDAFEEAKGGVGTWLTTWGSDWDRHIESALATARSGYLREVDKAIDAVADCVDRKLRDAKKRVAEGREELDRFVASLKEEVRSANEDVIRSASSAFDDLEASIDERRDSLVNRLTEQYRASYQRMSEREQELREANKSLWQRVYDATVGVIEKIIEFKNLLAGALGKAASVVTLIVDDPIGFLGNLIDAVSQGVQNFKDNIVEHLKGGFLDWLFGAVAGAGIQMPRTFDMRGILDLVLQVLGLTWQNIRRIATSMFGEPVVSAIERFAEPIVVLIREGPGGLWEWIKEKLSDLKQMFLDEVEDWLVTKVIKAGIAWILSLMNPVSAFIKACMAIYDIVMFFVERARQVAELVHAVTDSIAEIAHGSIGGAAKRVEDALAKAIPVAIGLLASLLNLGDITDTIKGFIDRIRQPVEKAIRWLIGKAVDLVKAAGKLLGIGKDQPVAEANEHDAAVVAGLEFLASEAQRSGGGADLVEAEGIASRVKDAHPVFKKVEPIDRGDAWGFDVEASDVHNTVEMPKADFVVDVREETISVPASSKPGEEWKRYEVGAKDVSMAMLAERFGGRARGAITHVSAGSRRGRSTLEELRLDYQREMRKGEEALGPRIPDYRTTIPVGPGGPDEVHIFDPTLDVASFTTLPPRRDNRSIPETKAQQLLGTIMKAVDAAKRSTDAQHAVRHIHYTVIAPVEFSEMPGDMGPKTIELLNEIRRVANKDAPPTVEITWAVVAKVTR